MKPFSFLHKTGKYRIKPTDDKININIEKDQKINDDLSQNILFIKNALGNSSDLVIRQFQIAENRNMALVHIDSISDKKYIQNVVMEIIASVKNSPEKSREDFIGYISRLPLSAGRVKSIADFQTVLKNLVSGNTIFLADGYSECLALDTQNGENRAIEEPSSQTVVRGPKDGFTENLRTNTALIRKRIKDDDLRVESMIIGRITKTNVSILYMSRIANPKIVEEIRIRLNRIDIDGIMDSGHIEELIQDDAYTPFPTIYNSERPDTIAAGLLEGRIAIIVDGSPFVLLAPAVFISFFQSSEDYYQHFYISSLIRILRYVAFFLTLLTPSIYIAITTFHQEMLPTPLLISIAAQREGVPFPAFLEALLMEATFEILREAGIRMPRAIGPAISIVGALVLGQAAVQAGIVSAVMVIVVSLTAISSFVAPSYVMSIAVRVLRFIFMLLAASLGLYGLSMGLIALVLHLCSLRSFGVPYMAPLAPHIKKNNRDNFLRFPIRKMEFRPKFINRGNPVRQK